MVGSRAILCHTADYHTHDASILRPINNARLRLHRCTAPGGAQTKVLHFIGDELHVVKDNLFETPPLFKLIQRESGTGWKEMYQV